MYMLTHLCMCITIGNAIHGAVFSSSMEHIDGKRIYIYIYRRLGGAIVRFILPPVTGRSASFRLRFRFVRAVRAGEAKLCGRMWDVVLIAGPPGC